MQAEFKLNKEEVCRIIEDHIRDKVSLKHIAPWHQKVTATFDPYGVGSCVVKVLDAKGVAEELKAEENYRRYCAEADAKKAAELAEVPESVPDPLFADPPARSIGGMVDPLDAPVTEIMEPVAESLPSDPPASRVTRLI